MKHQFMQSPTLQPAAEQDIFPSAPSKEYEKNKMDEAHDKVFIHKEFSCD